MVTQEPERDDLSELAELVSLLTEHVKQLQPEASAELDEIKAKAARLSASDRGPTRLRSLAADSITVTEPDGSVRLVISGQGTFPTAIQIGGEIIEHPRPVAGMLFFNDDGDECGGLIFGGGAEHHGGSLTFDKYQGDQVIQIMSDESDSGRTVAFMVNDQPDVPLPELIRREKEVMALDEDDREAALQTMRDEGQQQTNRIFVGRIRDGSTRVSLAAPDGTVRIVVAVTADGTPSIRFLDADRNVTWQAP